MYMRKIVLVFICSLFSLNYAFSQWYLVVKAASNLSNVINYPYNLENSSYKNGFKLGLITNYQINTLLGIQGELLYSREGFKEKDIIYNYEESYDMNVNSYNINFPVVVKCYPFRNGLNLHSGFMIQYCFSEFIKYNKVKEYKKPFGHKNNLDFGILLGLGFNYKRCLDFDLRYCWGLINSYKSIKGMNKRTIEFSVGYLFVL